MKDSEGPGTLDAKFSFPSYHPWLTSLYQGNISTPWTEQGVPTNSWVVKATEAIKLIIYMK